MAKIVDSKDMTPKPVGSFGFDWQAPLLPFLAHSASGCGGDTVTRGKPDPEGYLHGAALLTRPPHDCLVIGDAPAGNQGRTVCRLSGARHRIGLLLHSIRSSSRSATLQHFKLRFPALISMH